MLLVVLLAACAPSQRQVVRVSAAASLTDAMEAFEVAFEAAAPDVDLRLDLGGSSTLREQLLAGSPTDVFVSASEAVMAEVVAAGATHGTPVVVATNELALVVPAGNPAGVVGVEDLADPSLFVGLCAPQVPCGALARDALAAVGVEPALDSEEPDVRALLAKVAAGELDVGIVYATDVLAADGEVERLPLPDAARLVTRYPAVVVADAPAGDLARRVLDALRSPQGTAALAAAGFGSP